MQSKNMGALSGVSSLYSGSASSGGDIQTFQESGHHPQEELPHPTVTQASPTGRITILPSSALLLFVVILTTVSQTKMCICAPPVICIVNVPEHDKPTIPTITTRKPFLRYSGKVVRHLRRIILSMYHSSPACPNINFTCKFSTARCSG